MSSDKGTSHSTQGGRGDGGQEWRTRKKEVDPKVLEGGKKYVKDKLGLQAQVWNPNYAGELGNTKNIIATVHKISWIAHFVLTLVAIPIVIKSKYIISSKALFTGCLKRTIDNAPIIPSDKAILPVMVFVITYVINGKIINATVCACDFAQACPVRVKEYLKSKPPNIKIISGINSSIILSLYSF